MKICHFSDIHGYFQLLNPPAEDVELIVCTGDMFPHACEHESDRAKAQEQWFLHAKPEALYGETPIARLRRVLNGRPMITVPGNHDWFNWMQALSRDNVYEIKLGQSIQRLGLTFAGFRQIPHCSGRFVGEVEQSDFVSIVKKTLDLKPDILVTHAPPRGILDEALGINALGTVLMYGDHTVKHHFFGHIHECGGFSAEHNGIGFHNSATTCRVIDIGK